MNAKAKAIMDNSFQGTLKKFFEVVLHECERPEVSAFLKKDRGLVEIRCKDGREAVLGVSEEGETLVRTKGVAGFDDELPLSLAMQRKEFMKFVEALYEPKREEEDNIFTLRFVYYLLEKKPEEELGKLLRKRGFGIETEKGSGVLYDVFKLLSLGSYILLLLSPSLAFAMWSLGTIGKATLAERNPKSRILRLEKKVFPEGFEKERRIFRNLLACIRTAKENMGI